jgi:DNA-binding MarR family transcriptional regulator
MSQSSDAREPNSILTCLETLSRLHPDLSLVDICALTLVAERPGISLSRIARVLNVSNETVSRSLRTCAGPELRNALPPSLGLTRLRNRPDDARALEAYLTDRGAVVIAQLNAHIAAGVPI